MIERHVVAGQERERDDRSRARGARMLASALGLMTVFLLSPFSLSAQHLLVPGMSVVPIIATR